MIDDYQLMDEAGYDLKNYGMQILVVEGARPLRIILHSQFQIIRTLLPNLVKVARGLRF